MVLVPGSHCVPLKPFPSIRCCTHMAHAGQGGDDDQVRVMEAQNNRWLMVECEPHIWLLMVRVLELCHPCVNCPQQHS